MKKKYPKTITVSELSKNFTPEQNKIVADEIKYYDLLMKFKDAREKRGMTQEDVADKATINRTTLSMIESGSRNATIMSLMKIAQAMDMNLELRLY